MASGCRSARSRATLDNQAIIAQSIDTKAQGARVCGGVAAVHSGKRVGDLSRHIAFRCSPGIFPCRGCVFPGPERGYWDTRADDLESERIGVHRRLLVPSPMCIYPETRSDAAATPMTKSASYITDRTRALWCLGQARKRSNEVTDVCRALSGGRACRGRVDEGIERPQ